MQTTTFLGIDTFGKRYTRIGESVYQSPAVYEQPDKPRWFCSYPLWLRTMRKILKKDDFDLRFDCEVTEPGYYTIRAINCRTGYIDRANVWLEPDDIVNCLANKGYDDPDLTVRILHKYRVPSGSCCETPFEYHLGF